MGKGKGKRTRGKDKGKGEEKGKEKGKEKGRWKEDSLRNVGRMDASTDARMHGRKGDFILCPMHTGQTKICDMWVLAKQSCICNHIFAYNQHPYAA